MFKAVLVVTLLGLSNLALAHGMLAEDQARILSPSI